MHILASKADTFCPQSARCHRQRMQLVLSIFKQFHMKGHFTNVVQFAILFLIPLSEILCCSFHPECRLQKCPEAHSPVQTGNCKSKGQEQVTDNSYVLEHLQYYVSLQIETDVISLLSRPHTQNRRFREIVKCFSKHIICP